MLPVLTLSFPTRRSSDLDAAEKTCEGIKNGLNQGADFVDNTLVPAVDQAQNRFNEFAGDMKLSAAFNDESAKVNKAIADIAIGADGASIKIENWTGAIDRNNQAKVKMDDGLRGIGDEFRNQVRTGLEAGNTRSEEHTSELQSLM